MYSTPDTEFHKYVPTKDYKLFTADLKKVYGAVNLHSSRAAFDSFKQKWDKYPGAVEVWKRNFKHVEQLFDYGSNVRKVMYTTNAIESVNASFRKVVKKGSFPNEDAVYKVLYLRIKELDKKWEKGNYRNWSMVLNQLMINEKYGPKIDKYLSR